MQHKFYVVQVGYDVYGYGDTEQDAIDMANEFLDVDSRVSLDTISRFVGTAQPGSHKGVYHGPRKNMTQYGEMAVGEIVLLDAHAAEVLDYEAAV